METDTKRENRARQARGGDREVGGQIMWLIKRAGPEGCTYFDIYNGYLKE